MFDRPGAGERAVIVQLDLGEPDQIERLEEVTMLAESAGATVTAVQGRRQRPDPALFAGKGKVEEIRAAMLASEGDLVIFNHTLSPGQQRNLEKTLQCRVVVDQYVLYNKHSSLLLCHLKDIHLLHNRQVIYKLIRLYLLDHISIYTYHT